MRLTCSPILQGKLPLAEPAIAGCSLKPIDAISDKQRQATNDWYDHTLLSRLNDKVTGCVIIIMQRLHEDDLVGHVQQSGSWTILRFPAIAETKEIHSFNALTGKKTHARHPGEALHPSREPLEVLKEMREIIGEYNFAGQYQQSPAPLAGGMIRKGWFKYYKEGDLPNSFELVFQSWDTANKASELCDFSACTTWGVKENRLYLLHVIRKRLEYPDLKRLVRRQAETFSARNVLIEDKASGTQLIQELNREGFHGTTRYCSSMDKVMRMHSTTSTIENGFVYLPETAEWLPECLHEITTFPRAKHDDQVDSTSQALDWIRSHRRTYGLLEYFKQVSGNRLLDPPCLDTFRRS